jgi:DnaJ-class molecular chaperone
MEKYSKSKQILGLETDLFTHAELKKAYIKKAILCHPDKNNSTKESTEQFQELQECYTYLSTFVTLSNEKDVDNQTDGTKKEEGHQPDTGEEILSFMNDVLQGKYQQVFIDLVCGIKTISLTALERISKRQLQNIYDFLTMYGNNFFISKDMLKTIKDILDKKDTTKEILYSVSPTLNDLLCDKLYKLTLEDETYLVPLWHNEICYDGKKEGEDIIVFCNPSLPENVFVDSDNNLHVKISISLNSSLLNEAYTITLGKKMFTIPVNQLCITSDIQTICLPNCGILKINEDNFYDISSRSNIYFIVQLV